VDYTLLDGEGRLVEDPVCYRDDRTDGVMDRVFALVPREEIFARTGIQSLQLNTLYQLYAHVHEGLPPRAARLLLIPDYCHHLLCGAEVSERTDASTTQLLAASGRWDDGLFERLGLPRHLMPDLVTAGTPIGTLRPALCAELGLTLAQVVAPGTHDTASAVAGTPLAPGWAYVSSGTWSLVGVEREAPLLSAEAAKARLTNEAGVLGRVRLLANVMGLWLLESCRREWEAARQGPDLSSLLAEVARATRPAGVVYPDDPRFFAPSSMVSALRGALACTGQADVQDPVGLTQVVLDSLALRYASVVSTIERLTGQPVAGIHIVGGGSQNDYLNQATADASGREVLAGPVEAAALGNLAVQALGCGVVGSLDEARDLVARALPPRRFVPRARDRWADLAARYREIEEPFA
jgi:rhamnulokinase